MAKPIDWQPRGVKDVASVRELSPVGRFAPEGPVAEFVERFFTISWDLRGQAPLTRETLPHPSCYLVVEAGAGRSGLAGVSTARMVRVIEERGRVYGAKFHPGAFRPYWHAPVRTLTDRVVPLGDAFGPAGAALEERVLACGDDVPAAIALLEAFLTERVPAPDPKAALVRRSIECILAARDLVRAEDAAAAAGVTLRTLQRLYQDYVGVSPKWVVQRYRLHDAMEELESGRRVDLGGLALRLGFCDQAHFTRAFRKFLGRTPAGYGGQG